MGKEEATRRSNKSQSKKSQKDKKDGFKIPKEHKLPEKVWAEMTPKGRQDYQKHVQDQLKDSHKTNKSKSKESEPKEESKTVTFSEEKKDNCNIFSDKTDSDSKKRLIKVMRRTERQAKLTREPNNLVVVSASDTLKKQSIATKTVQLFEMKAQEKRINLDHMPIPCKTAATSPETNKVITRNFVKKRTAEQEADENAPLPKYEYPIKRYRRIYSSRPYYPLQ